MNPRAPAPALALSAVLWLAACLSADPAAEAPAPDVAALDSGEPTAPEPPAPEPVLLEGAALLRRVSLDLRGVLPTVAEVERVEADPAAFEVLVTEFLADARFEDQVSAVLAERWLTRPDEFTLQPADFGSSEEERFAVNRSIGQEAPRLAAWIAAEDRSWDEVATSEFTRVDALLLANWPVEAVDEKVSARGWRTARYTDGRPANGVLSTNGLWQRYSTSPSNLGRNRAAAVSRLFLCADFLTRPVTFSSSAFKDSDPETSARALPECVSCHASLDPLASALFGYWWFDRYEENELIHYHAEREGMGEWYLGVSPAWFGEPMDDAAQLGEFLVTDPRFGRCATETFAEILWRREVGLEDFDTISTLWERFDAAGRSPHALLRGILDTPAYRVGAVAGEVPPGEEAEWGTRRLLSASQLASVVEDLTGFLWTWEGYEQLDNDVIGFRVMAGGVDSETVTRPLQVPSVATLLVIRRLAEAGADTLVQRDLRGGAHELLTVGSGDVPGSAAFEAQLVTLYMRIFARIPTEEESTADGEFWSAVAEESGGEEAWVALVATLLRDPEFWSY